MNLTFQIESRTLDGEETADGDSMDKEDPVIELSTPLVTLKPKTSMVTTKKRTWDQLPDKSLSKMARLSPSVAPHPAAIKTTSNNISAPEASWLVKKARLSLINKSSFVSKPTSHHITAPEVEPGDLSKETIDSIFESSCSLLSFATRLMSHLFDKSELLKCRNVYGRSGPICYQIGNPEEALDEKRINIIRRLVEERPKPGDHTRMECVHAMNKKIGLMRRAYLSQENQ